MVTGFGGIPRAEHLVIFDSRIWGVPGQTVMGSYFVGTGTQQRGDAAYASASTKDPLSRPEDGQSSADRNRRFPESPQTLPHPINVSHMVYSQQKAT